MMNWIWAGMLFLSFAAAIVTGRMEAVSQAVMEGAEQTLTLLLSTGGMLCFWSGLVKIAEAGGLTRLLSRLFSPILRRLFPDYAKNDAAMDAISMNVTANLLGLGNAATPFGIAAMREMQRSRPDRDATIANHSMITFVVLNTASIQLLPTFLASIRSQYGSVSPFSILPAVWLTSAAALAVGLIVNSFCHQLTKSRCRT